jgi:hypothetical protein
VTRHRYCTSKRADTYRLPSFGTQGAC